MKTIAYLRVSTTDQDLEKFENEVLRFANEKQLGQVEFIKEQVSGTVNWQKRKVKEILEILQKDDALIVPELSRLGRSTLQVLEILKIAQDKGIRVYAVKGGWELNGTIQSKVLAIALGLVSEIERDFISMRTKEALQARKEKGLPLGRPKGTFRSKLDKHKEAIVKMLNMHIPQKYIAQQFNASESTLAKWLKRHKIK